MIFDLLNRSIKVMIDMLNKLVKYASMAYIDCFSNESIP